MKITGTGISSLKNVLKNSAVTLSSLKSNSAGAEQLIKSNFSAVFAILSLVWDTNYLNIRLETC